MPSMQERGSAVCVCEVGVGGFHAGIFRGVCFRVGEGGVAI